MQHSLSLAQRWFCFYLTTEGELGLRISAQQSVHFLENSLPVFLRSCLSQYLASCSGRNVWFTHCHTLVFLRFNTESHSTNAAGAENGRARGGRKATSSLEPCLRTSAVHKAILCLTVFGLNFYHLQP